MTEARIELPPLPAKGYGNDGHSDEAMREYARAAVLAERERCARVCEVWAAEDSADSCLLEVAADIRKGG